MLNNSHLTDLSVETDCQPHVEVVDIFRLYGDDYRERYPLSPEQRLVMRDIVQCRTAMLGGHIDECDTCAGVSHNANKATNGQIGVKAAANRLWQAAFIDKRGWSRAKL